MSPRVLILTRYDHVGASSRVRFLQYVPHLQRLGLQIAVQPLFSNEHLLRLYRTGKRRLPELIGALADRLGTVLESRQADVVWLQQELFPFLPAFVEKRLLARRPFVLDFDDAYHLYYQNRQSALMRKLYGDKIADLMRQARTVVVGNDMMADYARAAGAADVHLVYSAVDAARFAETADAGPPRDAYCIGWIGTPMTADQSLFLVRDPLKRFLSETGATCAFLGMDAHQYPDIPGKRVPWSEAAEVPFLADVSVGLCPLEDSPWTRGKSGYKIIQYMSAGRPTLTSPVGIAERLVEPGQTGFHCRTPNDWYNALTTLYEDATLRASLGRNARRQAAALYDTRQAAEQLCRILTSAAQR